MALQFKPSLPSIEELIISDNPALVRRERQLVKLLNTRFSGSIAPLLLLTRESLPEIKGLGPRSIRLILERLEAHDLRPRFYEEHAEKRAAGLYKGISRVPIQALYVCAVSYEPYRFTHYAESRYVDLLCQLDPSMTLGELTEMSRSDLRNYLKLKEVAIDSHWFNRFIQELRGRLRVWGLGLANEVKRDVEMTVDD